MIHTPAGSSAAGGSAAGGSAAGGSAAGGSAAGVVSNSNMCISLHCTCGVLLVVLLSC